MNKFNRLYEDIFKAATPEEVKQRKNQGDLERIKENMSDLNIKYIEDKHGNIIDIDSKNINNTTESGFNMLTLSLSNEDVIKLLLSKGADPNIKTIHGNTVLHFLISSSNPNRYDILKLLLNHKADINIVSNDGETPLSTACIMNDYNMIKLLLQDGADPNPPVPYNEKPWVIIHRQLKSFDETDKNYLILKMLEKYGAKVIRPSVGDISNA